MSAGLAALWADVDVVLVHDAARALTPPAVFERVVAAVDAGAAAVIPTLPVVDTIKRVDAAGRVVEGVDRSVLAAAQTPQGFRRTVLEDALAAADADHTDDAAAVAAAGHDVVTVDGDAAAFKITTGPDLERARALMAPAPATVAGSTSRLLPRVGIGTDVHGFGGEGTLWLAGLEWPGERALSGHSDGDAVAHAIVDALLAAAGLGDIGTHFGTDRPAFAGAHAEAFLAHTVVLLSEAGWRVGNVSVQVQANRPRFAARRIEAEQALSAALGGAPVSVSATTTDGLGFTGRTEGSPLSRRPLSCRPETRRSLGVARHDVCMTPVKRHRSSRRTVESCGGDGFAGASLRSYAHHPDLTARPFPPAGLRAGPGRAAYSSRDMKVDSGSGR